MISQGQEEAEAICLPHPSPLGLLRASLGESSECLCSPMQLDVVDIEEEISLGVSVVEGGEVAELWMAGVGSYEGGEEV